MSDEVVVTKAPERRPGLVLLAPAGLLCAAYLVLHALGGREATAVLSGTTPLDGDGVLGVAYAGAHLALVALAPLLAVAFVVRQALERVWPEP